MLLNFERQLLMPYACGAILRVWITRHSRAWALNSWMVKAFQGMSPQQLNDKAFMGISPQQLNDEHSKAWALNKVWVWNGLDLCISAYNSTTTTTTTNMHNQLWHTPQLGQMWHNNSHGKIHQHDAILINQSNSYIKKFL